MSVIYLNVTLSFVHLNMTAGTSVSPILQRHCQFCATPRLRAQVLVLWNTTVGQFSYLNVTLSVPYLNTAAGASASPLPQRYCRRMYQLCISSRLHESVFVLCNVVADTGASPVQSVTLSILYLNVTAGTGFSRQYLSVTINPAPKCDCR